MNRPQLKVIEGGRIAEGKLHLFGLIIVAGITFLYGLLIGFIVGKVFF